MDVLSNKLAHRCFIYNRADKSIGYCTLYGTVNAICSSVEIEAILKSMNNDRLYHYGENIVFAVYSISDNSTSQGKDREDFERRIYEYINHTEKP